MRFHESLQACKTKKNGPFSYFVLQQDDKWKMKNMEDGRPNSI